MRKIVFALMMLCASLSISSYMLNNANASENYFDDFNSYPDGAASFSGTFWDGVAYNGGQIDGDGGLDSSGALYMTRNSGSYIMEWEINCSNLQIYGWRFYVKRSYHGMWKMEFYSNDDKFFELKEDYPSGHNTNIYVCDNSIYEWSSWHQGVWYYIDVKLNDSANGWDVMVDDGSEGTKTTVAYCEYTSDIILTKIKIYCRRADNVGYVWIDNFTLYKKSISHIPEYEGYLKIGGVDTSTFYSSNYRYVEYKRWVYMSGVVIKRLDVAFDENENLSDVNDVECVLCGVNVGTPSSVKKYMGTYNYVWLAEWDNLDIELNGYITIELKRNGQNFKGLGIWANDIDGDGQKNLQFHNDNNIYGNGIAPEGVCNILYDLAYRIYYVYKSVEYDDMLLLNTHTLYTYDTLAIRYTCANDNTKLIIVKPDNAEAVNISVSGKGTYYYTPTATGSYKVHLYRDGNYVCNDTFIVLSGGDWGVWVDKKDANVGESITIYYNTTAPGIIDTGIGEYYVNGSGRIYETYYNRGQYTIKLYKLVNGTMYLVESEMVIVGSSYFTDTLHAYPNKVTYGNVVYLYGTTEHLLYSPYIIVYPENKIIPINSMEFNVTFYPREMGDHYVIMKVGNNMVAETNFIVVSEGAVRYELKYLVSLIFVIICAVLGITITSHFNLSKDVRAYVIIIFIFIGISTTALMNLLPLWVPFMLGLITVVWIIWKVVR